MYSKYYAMRSEPFAPFPSPSYFYESRVHRKTWWYLVQSLKRKDPVVLTAGEYGAGKTLLCLKLIRLMEKNSIGPRVYIPSPGYTFSMLLEKIAKELGITGEFSSDAECRRKVYQHLENQAFQTSRHLYIIIDDIHEFDYEFVSELNKLITYNHQGQFPIKLFMFGHTSFLNSLNKSNLLSFRQRIKAMPQLVPLNLSEVTEYIYYRLISSGASGSPVFEEDAVQLIASESKGLPRLINMICDNTLMVACKKRTNVIDKKIVELGIGRYGTEGAQQGVADMPAMEEPDWDVEPDRGMSAGRRAPASHTRQRERSDHGVETPALRPANTTARRPEEPSGRQDSGGAEPKTSPAKALFEEEEVNMNHQNRKKQKPLDLKKTSLLDTKNLMIASLVLVIILLLLFLFRGSSVSGINTSDAAYVGKVDSMAVKEKTPEREKMVSMAVKEVPKAAKEGSKVVKRVQKIDENVPEAVKGKGDLKREEANQEADAERYVTMAFPLENKNKPACFVELRTREM